MPEKRIDNTEAEHRKEKVKQLTLLSELAS